MFYKDQSIKIDFVVAWVDGSDKKWIEKCERYKKKEYTGNSTTRFRDWGFLKYWFRSVEANAPWVNKIYLIVDDQLPSFLRLDNPKLVIVNHKDYIPNIFLPTFNSHTIEINFHRIKNLSNYFVYFNDDMFLNKKINKTFFFSNHKPKYCFIERHVLDSNSFMSQIVKNDMRIVNNNIKRRQLLIHPTKFINLKYGKYFIKNLLMIHKPFQRFEDDHLACPFLKSTFSEIWAKEEKTCTGTSQNKFRTTNDINQYVFKYYDLARGNFSPKKVKHGGYYLLDKNNIDDIAHDIMNGINPTICLNDNEIVDEELFLSLKKTIHDTFDKRYPNKSSFEK